MTLADRILATAGSRLDPFGAAASTAESILDAQCFVFAVDTKAAMDQLAYGRPSSLLAALPICRLPFKSCWIEWPGVQCAARRPATENEPPVRSFGVMLEALDETHQRLGMSFVWDHHDHDLPADLRGGVNVCAVGYIVDWTDSPWKYVKDESRKIARHMDDKYKKMGLGEIEAINSLADTLVPTITPQMRPFIEQLRQRKRDDLIRDLLSAGQRDLEGEWQAVISALCLLNSQNCVEKVPQDFAALNKARVRRGKKPLISYSTVNIKLSRRDREAAAALGMSGEQIRQHVVRGHFKVRAGGLFWWRPFIRGSADAGEVRRAGYTVVAGDAALKRGMEMAKETT